MGDQMKLLFTLSNAKAANDTQDFYDKEIQPILESLLKQGEKDLNFISLLGDTIPHICAYNSLPKTLNSIYQFSLNNQLNLDLTRCDGKVGQTPIALAGVMGNLALVQWFLSKADVATAKVMLRRGDESEKLPVYFAASFPGNPQDPTIKNKLIDLLDPSETLRLHPDIDGISAQYVIKHPGFVYAGSGIYPIPRDCFGRTEFMINVFRHNVEGLQSALADCDSDEKRKDLVNAKDYCGRSALIYACYMGYSVVVDFLMPYANPNQADNRGQLPLHFAVLYLNKVQPTEGSDKTQIIQRLLDFGAKNLPNVEEKTPANFAFIMGAAFGNQQSMIAVAEMIAPTSMVKTPSRKTYLPGLTGEMAAMRISENKEPPAVETILTTTTTAEEFQIPDTRKDRKAAARRAVKPH